MTQSVLNPPDNALKYTSSGRVRLSAHPSGSGDEVQMAVSHSGPGIPAEHLPHIFDRFWRVDRARRRELGGAGLGLAIARDLVVAHGGEITVHVFLGRRAPSRCTSRSGSPAFEIPPGPTAQARLIPEYLARLGLAHK